MIFENIRFARAWALFLPCGMFAKGVELCALVDLCTPPIGFGIFKFCTDCTRLRFGTDTPIRAMAAWNWVPLSRVLWIAYFLYRKKYNQHPTDFCTNCMQICTKCAEISSFCTMPWPCCPLVQYTPTTIYIHLCVSPRRGDPSQTAVTYIEIRILQFITLFYYTCTFFFTIVGCNL